MEALSDEELIAKYRAEAGSPDAGRWLDPLFTRHHRRVALWCLRMTGDRESAADMAQEVFVRAMRGIESYRGDSSFSTWLYSIARNHCFNQLKSRASAPDQLDDDHIFDLASPAATPGDEAEQQSELRAARELVAGALNEIETQVFILHHVEDLPLQTITRLLKLENTSGAKAYLVSARRKLSRAVERWRVRENRARP